MARPRRPPRASALTDLTPSKIAIKIVILQVLYYLVAAILITFTTLVAGQSLDLAVLLDWRSIRADNVIGWTLALCWMLDSLVMVVALLLLVNRSKLIPDFALTIHGLHLVATTLYLKAVPLNLSWWLLQIASSIMTVMLGIWVCQRRELQPISFGGNTSERPKKTPGEPPADFVNASNEEREIGFGTRLGRLASFVGLSSSSDGRGNYEMTNLEERHDEGPKEVSNAGAIHKARGETVSQSQDPFPNSMATYSGDDDLSIRALARDVRHVNGRESVAGLEVFHAALSGIDKAPSSSVVVNGSHDFDERAKDKQTRG